MSKEGGFEDVLGTGAIRKKYLKTNPEGKKAEFGDEVIMTYSSYELDTGAVITKDEQVAFRIGDNETLAAMELMARLLREGESAEVHCEARYAYGNAGSFDEQANQDQKDKAVKFVMSLDKWVSERKIPEEMSNEELIVEANKKKTSGNRWFAVKNFAYATNCYKRALKVLEQWDSDENHAGNIQCKELLVALGNNVANVQCKLQKFKEAKDSSKEVLQVDPKNMKAIYRLAQIAYQQGDCDDAMVFIREALEIEPSNKAVRDLVKLVKEKREQQKQREKEIFGKKLAAAMPATAESATTPTATASSPSLLQNKVLVASIVVAVVVAVAYARLG
ncbi:FKBP-type peptidyl-prolyl cis-trans isomerase [Achlya hypogyna]|uniref:peptidylprolyl isomerase n=1 Tax=Achlya hypogyna TaxID=1202772 RepID=A0A1V9ZTN9_ACHHY|nr:FKBP-type peptidyl-prolyl cis-trans isomerase [Achlya hypogyna]